MRHSRFGFLGAALLAAGLLGGCGSVVSGEPDGNDAVDGVDGAEGVEETGDDGARDDASEAEVPPADADADADGDGETGGVCGDGTLDAGEECDDGEENSDERPNACRTDCRNAWCGDGVQDDGEACDDGNDEAGDGCEPACTFTCNGNTECDDGALCNGAESCVDHVCEAGRPPPDGTECPLEGGEDGVCRGGLCASTRCGNGTPEPDEECDDGNVSNTDDCLNDCTLPACGDGFIWSGHEACDGALPRDCTTVCGSSSRQSCEDCEWEACPLPPEECNAEDDDCDGGIDEDFACTAGATLNCSTHGAGGTVCWGTALCGEACSIGACRITTPDVCNGLDDNCDTAVDEPFACVAGTTVACTTTDGCAGQQVCSGTSCAWGLCEHLPEICDGGDNDCDTLIDEGFDCARFTTRVCTSPTGCPGIQFCDPGCVWGGCSASEPVSNDRCTTPYFDVGVEGVWTTNGTTCPAANDFTLACGGTAAAGPDVVFRMVLPGTREVTIDTAGSSFDTVLFVVSGAACPGTSTPACNDNDVRGASGTTYSRYHSTMPAGTYWIILDSKVAGDRGDYRMTVVVAPTAPGNDACTAATSLIPNNVLQSVTGTTLGADDDNTLCKVSPSPSPDVWYRFTLSTASTVYLSTVNVVTGFDTVLNVRTGSCTGAVIDGGCADDACGALASQFTGVLAAGTYYVAVDGFGSAAAGPFVLHYQASDCATPVDADPALPGLNPIGNWPGRWLGNTSGGTNRTRGTCLPGSLATGPDVYYVAGLCPNTRLRFSTCDTYTDFVTSVFARYGHCLASTDVACDYLSTCAGSAVSRGTITFDAGANQGLYFVWVDGNTAAGFGNYALNVSLP